jgi:putative polymerase
MKSDLQRAFSQRRPIVKDFVTSQRQNSRKTPRIYDVNLVVIPALVLAAMFFNAALCLINTKLIAISSAHVIGAEMLLISISFVVSNRSFNYLNLGIIIGTIMYCLTLALIRAFFSSTQDIDIKVIRDFLIPITFFMLGTQVTDLKAADRLVWCAIVLVAPLALLEYFYLDIFLQYFDIVHYYIMRGTLQASKQVLLASGNLMVSGIRPQGQGRELFSFLGDHRVSSIFLEPIGLACFGIITFMWGIVRSSSEHRFRYGLLSAGLLFIILADSRFGALFSVFVLLLTMLPPRISTIAAAILPGAAIIALVISGQLIHNFPADVENTTSGRLIYSAQVLTEFDFFHWLGFKVSDLQTFDAGYGYIISSIGLFGLAVFWCIVMSIHGPSREFILFRNASAAYFAAMSCIGQAQFTIKTASLLWFLLGVLSVARGDNPIVAKKLYRSQRQAPFASPASIGRDAISANRLV